MSAVAELIPPDVAQDSPRSVTKQSAALLRLTDWEPIRLAFVERALRPTWVELSKEFSVSEPAICRVAGEQGWIVLRAQNSDAKLAKSDVVDSLLKASDENRVIARSAKEAGLALMQFILGAIQLATANDKLKDRARCDMAQTLAFAYKNSCAGLKDIGVVDQGKALMDTIDSEANRHGDKEWSRQMLGQLNVTINTQQSHGTALVQVEPKQAAAIEAERPSIAVVDTKVETVVPG
jgi:hypothetical protein